MRAQLRIVSGVLGGRKLTCNVSPDLRPTPDRVREALFSILGNAIPDRVFVDIFAGTGVIGIEAISRGAKQTLFVERDVRLAREIERNLQIFDVSRQGRLYRTDAYRWVSNWQAPPEPVNVFFSPPFADLSERTDSLVEAARQLQEKVAPDSVIIVQSERDSPLDETPFFQEWEQRRYSRNVLFLWQKDLPAPAEPAPAAAQP